MEIAAHPIADALFLDDRLLDVIELGELFVEIRVPFGLDAPLHRPLAALAVDLFRDGHARHGFPRRREALAIQARGALAARCELRGARVRSPRGETDVGRFVARSDRI